MLKEVSLGLNILKSNICRLDFPYKLTHAVTYNCNGRCTTCNIWKKKPVNELSLEELTRFYRRSNGFNWISLTGGEVFLRQDIVEIVESIVKHCRKLHTLTIPTNGLLTDRIISCVQDMILRTKQRLIITISLDGPPKLHDELRGVPDGWKKTVETFAGLRKLPKVEAYFGLTLSANNVGKLEETISSIREVLPEVTPKDFHMNLIHESPHFYDNVGVSDGYNNEAIILEVRKFKKLKGYRLSPVFFLEQRYLSLIEKYLTSGKCPVDCKAASVSCFIDPEGTVYPCSIWNNKLGNLRDIDYDIKLAWDTQETKEIVAKVSAGNCPNCWTPCEAYQSILGNILRHPL